MNATRRDFVRTLFVASQAAIAGKFLSSPLHAAEASAPALNFAVIGDWGRQGRSDQREVAQQMAVACEQAKARFVISLGDNFYSKGVTSVDDPQWQQSFENVYTASSLQVPWYPILGNHDYYGNCDAQIEYGKTHPRWAMPSRYFKQTHQVDAVTQAEFFYIDTSPMILNYQRSGNYSDLNSQDPQKQMKWLEESLAASKASWKIVFGHHPIHSAGEGHGDQPELVAALLPLLAKYQVQAYFAGHDHDLQHLQASGVHLFVSGAGSEHRPVKGVPQSKFHVASSGFAMASLRANELELRLIDNQGKLLYSATAPRMS